MLSWICPECGRENDPAFQECPFCTPGLVKPQPAQQRRAGRRQPPRPEPVSLTFDTDYATAPFIDLASLRLPPTPPGLARTRQHEQSLMQSARPQAPRQAPPGGGFSDLATAPFIDTESQPVAAPKPFAPAALAPSVKWTPESRPVSSPPPAAQPIGGGPIQTNGTTVGPDRTAALIVEPDSRRQASPPPPPPQTEASGEDIAGSAEEPYIDTEFLRLPTAAMCMPSALAPDVAGSNDADGLTIDVDYALVLPQPPPAPAALASSVDWQPRSRMAAARPAWPHPRPGEGALKVSLSTDSPTATALAEPVTTALALAPQVTGAPEPFVFRDLAMLDRCNPSPWSVAVPCPVAPRPDLAPDHRSVLGMESDLLHLLEALRQSPNCTLLDGGSESALLPARPQDLEYVPTPRSLAPSMEWRPAVQAARPGTGVENIPAEARKWPGRRGEMPRTQRIADSAGDVLGPRGERLFRLFVRPDRRKPALWNTRGSVPSIAPPVTPVSAQVRLPAVLRGFHENGILSRPHVVRHIHRPAVPGWMVSLLTALVIILISTWVLEKSAFERFSFTRAEAASPTDAAQSAFPTMSKYVEVTGVRASVDTKTSEIRYVVVNHSAAELPPFQLAVKLHPKKGNTVVCSFTATLQGMGPNESREMRTTIPRELHSYDLPEWRDLRVEAHVTAK